MDIPSPELTEHTAMKAFLTSILPSPFIHSLCEQSFLSSKQSPPPSLILVLLCSGCPVLCSALGRAQDSQQALTGHCQRRTGSSRARAIQSRHLERKLSPHILKSNSKYQRHRPGPSCSRRLILPWTKCCFCLSALFS